MGYFFTEEDIKFKALEISKRGVYRIYKGKAGYTHERNLYVGAAINIKENLLQFCTGK